MPRPLVLALVSDPRHRSVRLPRPPPRAPRRTSSSARYSPAAATPARRSRTTTSSCSTAARPRSTSGGWTVQYASATGTRLAGHLARPARSRRAAATSCSSPPPPSIGAALPTPDARGHDQPRRSGGKVAVVRGSTALGLRRLGGQLLGGRLGRRPGRLRRRRSDYEGGRARAGDRQHDAAVRAEEGCTDTDANRRTSPPGSPTPRNSTAAVTTCGAVPPPSGRRVPGGDRGGRPPVGPLDRARARGRELRDRGVGHDPRAGLRARDRGEQQRAGYAVTVRRTAFQPADLPLGIAGTAPSGGQIGGGTGRRCDGRRSDRARPRTCSSGRRLRRAPQGGDVWDTRLGFVSPLPVVPAGRYTATVTFTAIGR